MKVVIISDGNFNNLIQELNKLNLEVIQEVDYRKIVKDLSSQNDILAIILEFKNRFDKAILNHISSKKTHIILIDDLSNNNFKELLEYNIYSFISKNSNLVNNIIKNVKQLIKNLNTKILVVDDSKTQLEVAKNLIEDMKIKVDTATDGLEALEKIEKNNYSLVLTDYNMPKIDGMELVIKLREKYSKDQLGIIVLSSSDKPEIATSFIKIGANDFINKPYSKTEVQARVSVNLELLDLFRETKDLANKDFLTGAYNRRYFFEAGKLILDTSIRENKNIAVAMFDIDNFKSINDTYGHDIGDIAIKEVVKILKSTLRNTDLIARFGGEEFCVILQNISLEDTKNLFETIRKKFEENEIDLGDTKFKFTTSIGVFYGINKSLEEMIKISDEALYFCKNNGKNQYKIMKG